MWFELAPPFMTDEFVMDNDEYGNTHAWLHTTYDTSIIVKIYLWCKG
jgi:hypothetical protein